MVFTKALLLKHYYRRQGIGRTKELLYFSEKLEVVTVYFKETPGQLQGSESPTPKLLKNN